MSDPAYTQLSNIIDNIEQHIRTELTPTAVSVEDSVIGAVRFGRESSQWRLFFDPADPGQEERPLTEMKIVDKIKAGRLLPELMAKLDEQHKAHIQEAREVVKLLEPFAPDHGYHGGDA